MTSNKEIDRLIAALRIARTSGKRICDCGGKHCAPSVAPVVEVKEVAP